MTTKEEILFIIFCAAMLCICCYAGYKYAKLESESSTLESEIIVIKKSNIIDEEVNKLSRSDLIDQLR